MSRIIAFFGGKELAMAACNGGQIQVFPYVRRNAAIDGRPRILPCGGSAMGFTPDGKVLAAADPAGIIRFWDIAAGQIVRTMRLDDKPAATIRVAAIQSESSFGKPQVNREHLASLARQAARNGAGIIVLPETSITGYLTADLKTTWQVDGRPTTAGLAGADPKDAAETVPGPSTEFFGQRAEEHGIYLTVPLVEVDRKTGRYYNTLVLLGPDGHIAAHYRKINPWPWAERSWATNGNLGHPVVDSPFGRLGLLICYDIHQQAKALRKLRVDTLLYSIAWVEDAGSDWFEKRLPAIARDNDINIIGANWTLPRDSAKPTWSGYGQTRIIGRTGAILARAGRDIGDEIVYADVAMPNH